MYRVVYKSPKVRDELEAIPDKDYERVANRLMALANNPRPHRCVKLSDSIYRIRVGDYRVIYQVDDAQRLIRIGKIDRRRERTYRHIEDLFS